MNNVLDSEPVYFDVEQENSEEESGVTIVRVERSNMAQKGKVTVTTGKDGTAKSKELYLGKYEVKETTASYGIG